MSGLARQLRWLIGIRLVVITSVALPYLLLQLMSGPPETVPVVPPPEGQVAPLPLPPPPVTTPEPVLAPGFLYLLASLTYLASLIYIALLRWLAGRYVVHAYIQFFGDLLLITGLIYHFGGISNPFSLLYLIVIAVASTLLRRRAGFTVATVAYCLYAGVILGLYFGWLPDTQARIPSSASIFLLTYNLAVHLFGFYAVAVLTHHLARRIARAERELEEKSEDLAALQVVHRDIVQSITSGLITTDLAGVVTSVNRAGLEILGKREEELAGRLIYRVGFFSQSQWEELSGAASDRPGKRRAEVEIDRGGKPAYAGFSISRLEDGAGSQRGYIVIYQDLTRFRQLQEEVRMKDRMAAVGELAAGIAHEIGNPLAAISGSVQMLSRSSEGRDAERKLLDILLKESQRLDRTIKGFLRFARPKDRSLVRFDVARLLAENFELLRNSEEVAPHHRLEIELDPPSVRLLADPDQVSQIFWNLAKNALKAMPDGGVMTLRGTLRRKTYVFTVADTGRGMTEEERANLFHPFQSFFDSGTGIGMAIVYRIVQEHGGRLQVDSRPGGGTRVTVELPVVESGEELAAVGRAVVEER